MTATLDELTCYVPAFVQHWLSRQTDLTGALRTEQVPAALLFADVSGFTPLSMRLAQLGPEGAEELDRLLNVYYAQLVDLIYQHGGDVLAYAGDAAVALWPATEESLADAVLRATQCGLEMQRRLNQFEVDRGVKLSMKVCVAADTLVAAFVGGVSNAWRPLVVGSPFHQIRALSDLVGVGEVLISAEAVIAAGDRITGQTLSGGAVRVAQVRSPLPVRALEVQSSHTEVEAALRSFISPAVLTRLDAGQSKWLADLRQMSVVFVNLGGVDSRTVGAMERLQAMMRLLQGEMERLEGQVVQLMEDDKGLVAILCLGLPPFIHEDDALRAVQAALAVHRELSRDGLGAGIGVATGRIFCGPRGSVRRREYAITGHIVNLAARLMGKSQGGILCDEATYKAASGKTTFEKLEPITLKGVPQPVPVFRPTGKSAAGRGPESQLAGRSVELAALQATLAAAANGVGQCVLIEGEPGIGKSVLLYAYRSQAGENGFITAGGACNTVEQTTPYFPWRSVLAESLGISESQSLEERRRSVLARLRFDVTLETRAALLNTLLDLEFPESDLVSQMTGHARADNLHELLLTLLNHAAEGRSLVVFLDDVQWMDASSWRLAHVLRQRAPAISLALAARPLDAWESDECRQFLSRDGALRIQLGTLDRDALRHLVRDRTGGAEPADELVEYLHERSQGNPFFAEELLGYLQDCNLLIRRGERLELATSVRGAGAASIPGSMRALITGRIDRLLPPEQMTLKTGSVIGRVFAKRTLAAVYEVPQDVERLDEHLQKVRNIHLIDLEPLQAELSYLFRHATIQQVVYDQIPRQNRRRLHLAIAQWYEQEFGSADSHLQLLAYHWGQASQTEKELEYLARAGESALLNFANREAAESFQAALDRQLEAAGSGLNKEQRRRRAHWERQLGEAHFHLGNLPEAQLHLEQSLELLERPAPSGTVRVVASTLWQLLRQMTHRCFPGLLTKAAIVDSSAEAAGGLHETALAFQRLSQLHYLTVEMPLGLSRAIRALNLAERAGKSPLLARSYSGMSLVTGMLRFHSLAERYATLAEKTAREVGNLPTLAYTLMVSGIYRMGKGRWEDVRRDAEESIALAEKLGDLEQLGLSITVRAMLRCFLADYEAAARDYELLHETAVRSENVVHQAWFYSGRGECQFRRGNFREAIDCFHQTLKLLGDMEHRTEDIRMNGMLAAAYWRIGEPDRAWEFAQKTLKVIAQGSYATVSTLEGFDGVAEVCLQRWLANQTDTELRRTAELAGKHLHWYAKVYPIGRPRSLCYEGRFAWALEKHAAARSLWSRALREAESLALPLERQVSQDLLDSHAAH